MQAKNILVWGLTPTILLFGLYLEVRDRPEEPLWAVPKVTLTPVPEVTLTPEVLPSPATIPTPIAGPEPVEPEFLDYWAYEEMWDHRFDNMTTLAFEDWEKTQAGVKVRIEGEVDEVKPPWGSRKQCQAHIEAPGAYVGYKGFWLFMNCDEARRFNKGDPVTLNCIMGDAGLIIPNAKECVIQ